MKLQKYLESLDKNENVYIGFKGGTGWMIIDDVEVILKKMGELDSECNGQAKRMYDAACTRMRELPALIVKQIEKIDNFEYINGTDPKRKSTREQLNDLRHYLREKENQYAAAYSTRKKMGKELLKWVPFWDRKVVEVYDKGVDLPGKCILIDGCYKGNLWWKGEDDASSSSAASA